MEIKDKKEDESNEKLNKQWIGDLTKENNKGKLYIKIYLMK